MFIEDFKKGERSGLRKLSDDEFLKYRDIILECYDKDFRFKNILDYITPVDFLDYYSVFKGVIGFRTFSNDFIVDVGYPKKFNSGKIKVYLAKKLDYSKIDNQKKIQCNPGSNWKYPVIFIDTYSETEYLKPIINYIFDNVLNINK